MDTPQPTLSNRDRLLPVPVPTAAPEAYERAPTLMAGAAPGGGGAVRVWAPSRRLTWIGTISSGAAAIALIAFMCWAGVFSGLYWVFTCLSFVVFGIRSLIRPCYMTTDDTGMGITTAKGSQSFRWRDVEWLEVRANAGHHVPVIVLYVPAPVVAILTGYCQKEIKELVGLVKARTNLLRDTRIRDTRNDRPYYVRYVLSSQVPALAHASNVGIGLSFERDTDGRLLVSSIETASPAALAGLMVGDEVLTINHLSAEHLDEESALSECRGREGTVIDLRVRRELWVDELEFQVRTRRPEG